MQRPTFRQLQIFAAVSRNKSFTRAAEELFVTQSTVSTQLKQLTEIIGLPLVEQIGKKIVVTDVGKRITQFYTELDQNWQSLEADLNALTSPTKGKVNVTGVYTCQYFFPRLLGAFREQYPDIDVSLRLFNRQQVLERIADNKDDLYILGDISEDLEMKAIPFIDNPLVVVAPKNHPLASNANLTLDALSEETFIIREPGSSTRREVKRAHDQQHIKFKKKIELGSNEAIKQGILGGLGISVLSLYAVAHELRLGILTALDVEGFPRIRHWSIAYQSGKVITPAVRTFLDFSKEDGRKIASSVLDYPHIPDSVKLVQKIFDANKSPRSDNRGVIHSEVSTDES